MIEKLLAFLGFFKMSKVLAGYTDQANTTDDCGGCINYLPKPWRCEIVAGRISPNGWCRRFASKTESHTWS